MDAVRPDVMLDADLRSIIEASLSGSDRGDERFAHVSDLWGCDRATWARRSGRPLLPFDAPTRWKFALGHDVEARVADALVAASSIPMRRNTRLAWNPATGTTRDLLESNHATVINDIVRGPVGWPCNGCPACLPVPGEIVGHVDLDARGFLVGEVKSVWFASAVPRIAKPGHKMQALTYAVARAVDDYFLQYVCVTIHGRRTEIVMPPTFWHKTERDASDAVKAGLRVLEATDPEAEIPEANPPEEWQCRYCRFAACSLNENPSRGFAENRLR